MAGKRIQTCNIQQMISTCSLLIVLHGEDHDIREKAKCNKNNLPTDCIFWSLLQLVKFPIQLNCFPFIHVDPVLDILVWNTSNLDCI